LIKLYQGPFSTNVERVSLALAFKGLEAEPVVIDWNDRRPVEEVSGQSLVPVIDDGGRIVADSTRIFEYLEERNPEPPLYPADPARRAETEVFIDWFNQVWKRSPNGIEDELDGDADPAAIARHSQLMAESMDLFERLLAGRDHMMGDEVSAADFAAFPFLKYALLEMDPADDERFHRILFDHLPMDDEHPRLRDWIERIDALPRA
jgi:glutathione S-transferase